MSSAATTAETPAPPPPGRTPRRAAPASWMGGALTSYDSAEQVAAEPAVSGAGR
ncbi:UNVERIFIED_CONTAM: hypothetical protein RF653_12665 [Kocuria sp. CPCC 205316]|uniref:hypothetical protein n=1 Tax=Kocuria TaxID=57493 RepID=UPI0036DE754E